MNDLLDALDRVMTWDLPEEALPEALTDQFRLLTGGDPEEPREVPD
jgi:hypothetical protein